MKYTVIVHSETPFQNGIQSTKITAQDPERAAVKGVCRFSEAHEYRDTLQLEDVEDTAHALAVIEGHVNVPLKRSHLGQMI